MATPRGTRHCRRRPQNRRVRMLRAAVAAAAACTVAATAASLAETPPAPTPSTCVLEGGEDRTVTRVIDGETLQLEGGGEVKLIGALAPRGFDSTAALHNWPLAEQARAALNELVASRSVRLAFAGRRTDRYGRLLAHVFSAADGKHVWVQGEILKRGLARAYALDGSLDCLTELIAHETVARESAQGLWTDTTYALRSADDVSALLRLTGTFQIVEGKVAGVSEVRGSTYINFGEDWRQDFTVMRRAPLKRNQALAGVAPQELNGRRVRVRGWIERRGGPMIEIRSWAEIEVLAPQAEAEPTAPAAPARRRSRSVQ